jgi:hypothetical protein
MRFNYNSSFFAKELDLVKNSDQRLKNPEFTKNKIQKDYLAKGQ